MKRQPFSRTANDAPFAIRGRPIAEPRYEASHLRAVLLDLGEYMDYALEPPSTHVLALFVEAVREPEVFVAALVPVSERC